MFTPAKQLKLVSFLLKVEQIFIKSLNMHFIFTPTLRGKRGLAMTDRNLKNVKRAAMSW